MLRTSVTSFSCMRALVCYREITFDTHQNRQTITRCSKKYDYILPFVGMEVLKKKAANWKLVLIGNQQSSAYCSTTKAKSIRNRYSVNARTCCIVLSTCRPHGIFSNLNVIILTWRMLTSSTLTASSIHTTISHFVTSVRSESPGVQAQSFTNENVVHRVVSK